ncbi:uncharacterized protein LAJ45_11054 [Morchella importuna]|uniref:uncharacterized protein n=1 Tax=Morchella importuna TaxID=1174673 RepID=UPI001E8D2D8B|nr:uncharacterized protein LAJ45_11054 [Morchella importuna]KAH8144933.1 hypothetical protein LAJ45_11054 [Morchella importuna]
MTNSKASQELQQERRRQEQEQQEEQQKSSKEDRKKDPKKVPKKDPKKEQNQEPNHEPNGGPSTEPNEEQKMKNKIKKKPKSITIVEYEISCDEMGITIPRKPYLPRLTYGAVMDDLGINCIRELSQAAARLQRTGEEDGIYVEIDPDEWVELDTAGNDVEREDEADPDEEEYVLL